jgi:excisionase family DNA binding protein
MATYPVYDKVQHSKGEPMKPPLLTKAETAAKIGVSERTVERFIKVGKLHPMRIGGRVKIAKSEIDRFLEQCVGQAA